MKFEPPVLIEVLQSQFAAFLAVYGDARGVIPLAGQSLLSIATDGSLASETLLDEMQKIADIPGLGTVERQGAALEFLLDDAGAAKPVLARLRKAAGVAVPAKARPALAGWRVIAGITAQHALQINRARKGAMVPPGASVVLADIVPVRCAGQVANRLERDVPGVVLVHADTRSGRVIMLAEGDSLAAIASHLDRLPQAGG